MADLFDKQNESITQVPDAQVADALRSRQYNLPSDLVTDDNHVRMVSPEGNAREIPMDQLWDAFEKQYRLEPIAAKEQRQLHKDLDNPLAGAAAIALGGLKGFTLTGIEPGLVMAGVRPDTLRALQDVHSGKYLGSELVGAYLGLGKAKAPIGMLAKFSNKQGKKVSEAYAARILGGAGVSGQGINLLDGVKTVGKGAERLRRAKLKTAAIGTEAMIDGVGFSAGQYANDAFLGRIDYTGQTLAESAWQAGGYLVHGAGFGLGVGGIMGALSVPLKSTLRGVRKGYGGLPPGLAEFIGPVILADKEMWKRIRQSDNPTETALNELIGHHSLQALDIRNKTLMGRLKGQKVHNPVTGQLVDRYEAAKVFLTTARVKGPHGEMVPIIDGATSLDELANRLHQVAEKEGGFLRDKVYPWLDSFNYGAEKRGGRTPDDIWVGVNPIAVVHGFENLARSLSRETDAPMKAFVQKHVEGLKTRIMNEAGIPERVPTRELRRPKDAGAEGYYGETVRRAKEGAAHQTELEVIHGTRERDFQKDYVDRLNTKGNPRKDTHEALRDLRRRRESIDEQSTTVFSEEATLVAERERLLAAEKELYETFGPSVHKEIDDVLRPAAEKEVTAARQAAMTKVLQAEERAAALQKHRLELQKEKGGTRQEKTDRARVLKEIDDEINALDRSRRTIAEEFRVQEKALLDGLSAQEKRMLDDLGTRQGQHGEAVDAYNKAHADTAYNQRLDDYLASIKDLDDEIVRLNGLLTTMPKPTFEFRPVRWTLAQARKNRDGYDPKSMFDRTEAPVNAMTARAMRRIWADELNASTDRIVQNMNFGARAKDFAPRKPDGKTMTPKEVLLEIDKAKSNFAIADDLHAMAQNGANANLAHSHVSLNEALMGVTGAAAGQTLFESVATGALYRGVRRYGHSIQVGGYRRLAGLEAVRSGSVDQMVKSANKFIQDQSMHPTPYIMMGTKAVNRLALEPADKEGFRGRQAAVIDLADQLADLKTRPADVADRVSLALRDLEEIAPDVAAKVAETRIRGLNLLTEKAIELRPARRFNQLQPAVFAEADLSPSAVSRFERYVGAVAQFAKQFFAELQAGVTSAETIEVGTIVYPEILDEIRIQIAEELGSSDQVMQPWKTAALSKLYRGGVTADRSPDFLRRQVLVYATEREENVEKSASLAGIRRPKKRASDRKSMTETASQRIAGNLG